MGKQVGVWARRVFVWGVCAALLAWAVGSAGADQPTLDELLELGSPEEQREALRESAGADEADDAEPEAAPEAGEGELEESLQRMLERDRPADVFARAVREMGDVSQRLGGRLDAGIETQRMQQGIIDKLDQVIDAARQQQQQSDSSDSGGDGSPEDADSGADEVAQQAEASDAGDAGADAQEAGGEQPHSGEDASPGQASDAQDYEQALGELRQEWGNLPPRLREEISQGMNERFSPVYRSLTEAYYRQLAEEE